MNRNINWLPNAALLVFGLVFLWGSLQLEPDSAGGIGARSLPLSMSVLLLILVAVQTFFDFRKPARKAETAQSGEEATDNGSGGEIINLRVFALYSGPVFLLVVAYGFLHGWFGYFLSTLLSAIAVFLLFRNTPKNVLLHSVVGTFVFYFVFIYLLNVYDPPGSLVDVSELMN